MGNQTLFADEPAGRSSSHRLTFLLLAPMGASSKTTETNNLPEFQGRSKVRKTLDTTLGSAIRNAQDALAAVTRDFRGKLLGAWSYLLWSVFAGGLLSGFGLLFLGYWLARHL
jgi:hypothetical protein